MTKGTATELFFKSHNVYSQAYESFAKDYTADSDQMGLTMVSNGYVIFHFLIFLNATIVRRKISP